MQEDFHYYATYCAAYLAGYSHEESMIISYSALFVDLCSATLLSGIKAPVKAATTQLQMEMMDARTDVIGLQNITRIWAPFHFLPRDLYAKKDKWRPKLYLNKYRLICGPNGPLVADTIELAKGRPLQSVGIAMHVMADTWAHRNFAGTPSLVINNTNDEFYEFITDAEGEHKRKVKFRHNPSAPDDLEAGIYTNSLYQRKENTIMNLGHGRAGHLPDYSFIKYMYLPAWDDYRVMVKDNPSDYIHAFCQMIYAMKYIRGDIERFETDKYDFEAISPYADRINYILRKRQLDASEDWKSFGEDLSGQIINYFDVNTYQAEYITAEKKNIELKDTFLGAFIEGAIAHKGMVCDKIFQSGNKLVGFVQGIER